MDTFQGIKIQVTGRGWTFRPTSGTPTELDQRSGLWWVYDDSGPDLLRVCDSILYFLGCKTKKQVLWTTT